MRSQRIRRKLLSLARREQGQSLVEFALIMPIASMCLFGVIYLCLVFYSLHVITNVAEDASRYASVRGAACLTASGASCTVTADQISSYVTSAAFPNLAGGQMTATASFPDGNQNAGSRVSVTVQYSLKPFVPFVPPGAWKLSTVSQRIILQ